MSEEDLTIPAARALSGTIVYGLVDEVGVIFYVGQTRHPINRFKQHERCITTNMDLAYRIQRAGGALRVRVLHLNPIDVNSAERHEIRARPGLVNCVGRPGWTRGPEDRPWRYEGMRSPIAWMLEMLHEPRNTPFRRHVEALNFPERCAAELDLLMEMRRDAPIPEAELVVIQRFERWLLGVAPKMQPYLENAKAKLVLRELLI